ncbi:MAG: branched-chain amino acid transport system permease protein [Glaciecola sp.]|jgi:branched-chain amino acid transport system permease protein
MSQPRHRVPFLPTLSVASSLRTVAWGPRRNETIALGALFLTIALLPVFGGKSVPLGIYGRGLVSAAVLGLHAVGIVLTYRSNRFINFAQLQLGALGGTVFALVVQAEPFFRGVQAVCPPCMAAGPSPFVVKLNYLAGIALGLLVAVGLGGAMYAGVVRRLTSRSRLVLTVASLFVIQVLSGLRDPIVNRVVTPDQAAREIPGGALPPPWNVNFTVGGANFTGPDVLILVVALVAVVSLVLYLRFTATGTAIRAASQSRDRAETLGIRVDRVTTRVWLLAGALSGVAAITTVMRSGEESISGGLSVGLLVRILAAVIVARLTSIPRAAIAAIAFGLLDQVVLWVFGSTLLVDGALVIIIGVLLLAQRATRTRSDADGAGFQAARELRPIPAVLRQLPDVRRYVRIGTGSLVVVLAAIPWIMSPSQTNRITTAVIYAIVGLSLLVLTGWGGLVSLGQFAFAAVGAWVVAVLGLPLVLALIVGPVAGATLAVLVGIPALKLEGLYLAITTLAFSLATTAILLNTRYLGRFLPDELNRPRVLGFDLDDQRVSYYFMLAMLAAATVAVTGLRRTRTGRVLIASRDNEALTAQVGISIMRARLSAFALSGFLAALAGVLFSYQQGGVRPDAFSAELSVRLFVSTVIGGFGSVVGPILGFTYFAIVSLFSSSETVIRLTSGIGGLGLLLALPGGLAQAAYSLRDSALRRVAKRHRIVVPSLIADQKAEDVDGAAPIRPKVQATGTTEFIARRYGLQGQWLVDPAGAKTRVAVDESVPAFSGQLDLQESADV